MPPEPSYSPSYHSSFALIIGVDEYTKCDWLQQAKNDATSVSNALRNCPGFKEENIKLLLDKDATKNAILSCLTRYSTLASNPDDRLLVFFAGHGHTIAGNRGEIGYLVPVDGDPADPSSLIRWTELTDVSDLIPAKHVFFVMDACYGGLALPRHLSPGATRFLKDILQRSARQVLTAGKANQPVADGGGPRAGNSMFTGHLLNALSGGASGKEGVITANGVMAYVYDRVSKDRHSRQTPHYGYLEGDGDFVFSHTSTEPSVDPQGVGSNVIADVPASLKDQPQPNEELSRIDRIKNLLSDTKYRIQLEDFIDREIRTAVESLGEDEFPIKYSGQPTAESVRERIRKYDTVIAPLLQTVIVISKWADANQLKILKKLFARICDIGSGLQNGFSAWLQMRWYPICCMQYVSGIAAIASDNYQSLAASHTARTTVLARGRVAPVACLLPAVDNMFELQAANIFKQFPGRERQYVSSSEYLFDTLQPVVEDMLYLGGEYESLFDRYEVLRSLMYANIGEGSSFIGRFGWKYKSDIRGGENPFRDVVHEAESLGANWFPLQSGLFNGSIDRFREAVKDVESRIASLPWY